MQLCVFQVISVSYDGEGGAGGKLEHKTCDILADEQLRLMRFDNRLIIESVQKAIYSNGNFGCVFLHYPTLS